MQLNYWCLININVKDFNYFKQDTMLINYITNVSPHVFGITSATINITITRILDIYRIIILPLEDL